MLLLAPYGRSAAINIFASYFLQMLFWVDGTISSQSSFDKIVTSFFWSTPRRRREDNFQDPHVLQASIPQQYLYVDSCWTTSCSPSVCLHPRYQLESSQIGSYYPVFPSLIFSPSRNLDGYFWHPHLLHTLNRESRGFKQGNSRISKKQLGT